MEKVIEPPEISLVKACVFEKKSLTNHHDFQKKSEVKSKKAKFEKNFVEFTEFTVLQLH